MLINYNPTNIQQYYISIKRKMSAHKSLSLVQAHEIVVTACMRIKVKAPNHARLATACISYSDRLIAICEIV